MPEHARQSGVVVSYAKTTREIFITLFESDLDIVGYGTVDKVSGRVIPNLMRGQYKTDGRHLFLAFKFLSVR